MSDRPRLVRDEFCPDCGLSSWMEPSRTRPGAWMCHGCARFHDALSVRLRFEADQEDTDASNDMPGASSLRSRSGDAVNAETTSLDGGGRQPGIERIMGRIVITSALNREVPGLTQSQYDRMADAAMDALINGDCLVPADQEDIDEQ